MNNVPSFNGASWRRHIQAHQNESFQRSWRSQIGQSSMEDHIDNILPKKFHEKGTKDHHDNQVVNTNLKNSTTTASQIASTQEAQRNLKRKAFDSENCDDLDLNLSLKITPKDHGGGGLQKGLVGKELEVDSSTSLSLSLSPSSSKLISRFKEEGGSGLMDRKHGRLMAASTLDLTL